MKDKILILGGTEFVGRLLVTHLLADPTKEVHLFNRGKTNPHLFPTVHHIKGDRETDDINQIKDIKWDYIVDFSSFFPASLKSTLQHINRDVKQYIYISTISVYDFSLYDGKSPITENFKSIDCDATEAVDQTMKTYGKRKAACEAVLAETDWLNTIILRPSVIYGAFDPTDRFYYWLKKIKTREQVIIPNDGKGQISLTYANDLASIIYAGLNDSLSSGVYNCSTHHPVSFNELLGAIRKQLNPNCQFIGMDIQALRKDKVWLPLSFISNIWIDHQKISTATNISFQPYNTTIPEVIQHFMASGWPDCKVGMNNEVEQNLIDKKGDSAAFKP